MMRTSMGWEKEDGNTGRVSGMGCEALSIFVIGRDSIDRMGDRAKRGFSIVTFCLQFKSIIYVIFGDIVVCKVYKRICGSLSNLRLCGV